MDTSNASIIQLMQSITFDGDQIVVKEGAVLSEEILKTGDYQQKLWYIFEKLISSKIYCIHRSDDYRAERHHPIKLQSPFSENLLFPKWASFNFGGLLEAIQQKAYAFGHPDRVPQPLRDGLLDGYVLARMSFWAEAYDIFKKLENEAGRAGDRALQFLSRRNRVLIGQQIRHQVSMGIYSKSYGEVVQSEIKEIDLKEQLRSIKIENSVKELLTSIESGAEVKHFSDKIESKFDRILELHTFYKNDFSWHDGPDFSTQIEWEFQNLHWFFDSNGLLVDDEKAFEKAAQKTFESLVASHQTPTRYENRYQKFDAEVLMNCLFWLEPKKVKGILAYYGLESILFADEHKAHFVMQATNFFKSGYEEDSLFGQVFENRLYQDYLRQSNFFAATPDKRLIPNLLRILSIVDLSDLPEGAIKLCDTVLKAQRFLPKNFANLEEFEDFYCQHLQFFGTSQIQEIFDLLADRGKFSTPFKLTKSLQHWHPDFRFSNAGFWEKWMRLPQPSKKRVPQQLVTMVHLHEFLTVEQLEQLRDSILWQQNFDPNLDDVFLLLDAMFHKVIPMEPFSKQILNCIKNNFSAIAQVQFKPDGQLLSLKNTPHGMPDAPHDQRWLLTKLCELNFKEGLDKSTIQWFMEQPDLPLCLRWLLQPKLFDYSKFDHFWLFLILSEEPIFEKLRQLEIKELSVAIQNGLQTRFSEKLSKVYFLYFLKASRPPINPRNH